MKKKKKKTQNGSRWRMDDGFRKGDEMNKRRLFISKKKKIIKVFVANILSIRLDIPPPFNPRLFSVVNILFISCARVVQAASFIAAARRSSTTTTSSSSSFLLLYSKWDWAERIVVRLNGHGCFRILSAAAASPAESISLSLFPPFDSINI